MTYVYVTDCILFILQREQNEALDIKLEKVRGSTLSYLNLLTEPESNCHKAHSGIRRRHWESLVNQLILILLSARNCINHNLFNIPNPKQNKDAMNLVDFRKEVKKRKKSQMMSLGSLFGAPDFPVQKSPSRQSQGKAETLYRPSCLPSSSDWVWVPVSPSKLPIRLDTTLPPLPSDCDISTCRGEGRW